MGRYVAEHSVECKQSMCPEAVAPQNKSSGIGQSVGNMGPHTPIFTAPLERPAEPSTPPTQRPPPHLAGKVTITVQGHGPQPPPSPARSSPLLEQPSTLTLTAVPVKEGPVNAVPIKVPQRNKT